jgi:hypothetical protein
MHFRQSARLPSYRFYRALQRQQSPMRYICEISEPRNFRVFHHNRSKSEIGAPLPDVSFAPRSGHREGCPVRKVPTIRHRPISSQAQIEGGRRSPAEAMRSRLAWSATQSHRLPSPSAWFRDRRRQ